MQNLEIGKNLGILVIGAGLDIGASTVDFVGMGRPSPQ